MLTDRQFRILLAVAALALALVVTNVVVAEINRVARIELAARQETIQRGKELEGLYREIVRALADLSVRNRDVELKNLLAGEGIAVTVEAPAKWPAATNGGRR